MLLRRQALCVWMPLEMCVSSTALVCRYDPKLVEGFKVDPKSGFLTSERFNESQELPGKQGLISAAAAHWHHQ